MSNFQDTIIQKMLKGAMQNMPEMPNIPNMPNMDNIMEGYEFKDGKMKLGIDYWTSDRKDLNMTTDNVIVLTAAQDVWVPKEYPVMVETNLTLRIKSPTTAFLFFNSTFTMHDSITTRIILPNNKNVVSFHMIAPEGHQVIKGTFLGYGIFVPFVPTNNISFTNQNEPT